MFVYVFANVMCSLALKWVAGLMRWNYLYFEREGEEESVSIEIYLQGEGL